MIRSASEEGPAEGGPPYRSIFDVVRDFLHDNNREEARLGQLRFVTKA